MTIVAAAVAAYANTFRVPFHFDDVASIADNPTIRQLWPLSGPLSPPAGWGFTVSGRPILNLTLAINYAISGPNVWSYHAFNLLIHTLAGLALFGIVRRTLLRPALAARFRSSALPVAWAIAALWTLHPLQTESVTYLVQRAESLMGLFFLLTLYAFIRGVDSSQPWRWWTVSFLACLLGVGTKEVTALAPLLILLYDRTFVSGGFAAAWQRHRWPLLLLAATWVPLAILLAETGGNRGGTVGFDIGVSWTGYWLTQFEAITRYVGLVVWPHPSVFDYGKISPPALAAAAGWSVPVLVLVGATVVALWRAPIVGFCGAWFFALLAPTSVVPGALQMIVEHRLYLSLAGAVALALGAAARWWPPRTFLVASAVLALAAGVMTVRRNAVYGDERRLWEDTLAKRPENARAHSNLGLILYRSERLDEAIAHYRESLRLDASDAHVHYNLGLAWMKTGRLAEAVAPLSEAVRILPYYFNAQLNLGIVLMKLDRAQEAVPHFAAAIRHDPAPAEAQFQLGVALAALGRWTEAIEHYALAVQGDPQHAEAQSNWGVALLQTNSMPAAIEHFTAALHLRPGWPAAHFNLAQALARSGRTDEALAQYAEVIRLDPAHADAHLNLGIALAQTGKLTDGIAQLEQAVRLRPDAPETHTNLALALLDAKRSAEALAHYETALRLRPADPRVHYNVGYALLVAGRWPEARARFEDALKIDPGFTAARAMLEKLPATPR